MHFETGESWSCTAVQVVVIAVVAAAVTEVMVIRRMVSVIFGLKIEENVTI